MDEISSFPEKKSLLLDGFWSDSEIYILCSTVDKTKRLSTAAKSGSNETVNFLKFIQRRLQRGFE